MAQVFLSYCRADMDALKEFESYRKNLERYGLITVWIDELVLKGEEWKEAIEKELKEAKVAILFISESFLASDFIYKNELPPIISANISGNLTIIPVFLSQSTVDQIDIPFINPKTKTKDRIKLTKFQGFGSADVPLEDMKPKERKKIFVDLVKRIRELVPTAQPESNAGTSEQSVLKSEQSDSVASELPAEIPKQNRSSRTDSNARYQKLEKLIAEALMTSGKAMELLEAALSGSSGTGKPGSLERAQWLTKRVMELRFEIGQAYLLRVFRELNAVLDQTGVDAIKKVSRFLIPWLYVASQKINMDAWDQGLLGEIRTIPAGISSFAEIVFAGMDHREVAWKEISDSLCFPRGFYGVEMKQPESGPLESVEQNLRVDLLKTVKSPGEVAFLSDAKQDDSIARRIQWLFGEGFRVYLVCWVSTHVSGYQEQITRIQGRYPFLAVVMLNTELLGEHQTLFDEIRPLML